MRTRSNLFQGVNPLLMSYLQSKEGYHSFHTNYATYLTGFLNSRLPDSYQARTDDDLHILEISGGLPEAKRRIPDVLIETSGSPQFASAVRVAEAVTPTLEVAFPEALDLPTQKIVVIEAVGENKPVTIFEILSPTNKLIARAEYSYKRAQISKAEIALVEIDWLHESSSVIWDLPEYPYDEKSSPYYIALTNPRRKHKTDIYQWGIHQPMPTLPIPLLNNEWVTCDFEAVYQETFGKGRFGNEVDYAALPLNFTRYSQSDQAKIQARLDDIRGDTSLKWLD